jgi:hypothetical protein
MAKLVALWVARAVAVALQLAGAAIGFATR